LAFWIFLLTVFCCLGVIHLLLIINFSAGYSIAYDFTLNTWISTDAKIMCKMLFILFPGH